MDTNEEREAEDEASMERGGKYSQAKILQRKMYNLYEMKHSVTSQQTRQQALKVRV